MALLIESGAMSQFRGTGHKRVLSSRYASMIWVRMKMFGSVSLFSRSIRAMRNERRGVLGLGMGLEPCPELSFAKVREGIHVGYAGIAHLSFWNLIGLDASCRKSKTCWLSMVRD